MKISTKALCAEEPQVGMPVNKPRPSSFECGGFTDWFLNKKIGEITAVTYIGENVWDITAEIDANVKWTYPSDTVFSLYVENTFPVQNEYADEMESCV